MIVLLLLILFAVEVQAHGEYVGPYSEEYTFLGCDCGDSRTELKIVRSERWYYENPNPPPPNTQGVKEQAPGLHWHTTISYPCVSRSHAAYRRSCDDQVWSCKDEWVKADNHFKKCGKIRSNQDYERILCHYQASIRYKRWTRDCDDDHCYYYRYVKKNVCKYRLAP